MMLKMSYKWQNVWRYCGGKFLYDKIKIIVAPEMPSKVSVLKQASMANVEKAKFQFRVQNRGESVSEFAFELELGI